MSLKSRTRQSSHVLLQLGLRIDAEQRDSFGICRQLGIVKDNFEGPDFKWKDFGRRYRSFQVDNKRRVVLAYYKDVVGRAARPRVAHI